MCLFYSILVHLMVVNGVFEYQCHINRKHKIFSGLEIKRNIRSRYSRYHDSRTTVKAFKLESIGGISKFHWKYTVKALDENAKSNNGGRGG